MLSATYYLVTNVQSENYMQILKRELKALASKSSTLQMNLSNFLLQCRKTPHVTTGNSPAYLFLKRHIRIKIDLIVPSVTKVVHDKQKA